MLAALAATSGSSTGQSQVAAGPLDQITTAALEAPELSVMAAGLIDSIGGRLSGTVGGARAERWAAAWLRAIGFDSVWNESVAMPAWQRGALDLAVAHPPTLRGRRLVAAAYGYSPKADVDSVPLIDIGRGDMAALAELGRSARGAALLTDVVTPEVIALAERLGAAALLRVTLEPGRLPQARVAPVQKPPAPLPIIALAHEDGIWLRRMASSGELLLRIRLLASTAPGTTGNVVGELRGSDPLVADELVLVGAHLDAWDVGDGALDNASGVLAVMTAARALAGAEARPRRTVRVVFFAGEELGLWGSRGYVEARTGALGSIVAMLNMDMVGAPLGYGATGHPEADSMFARLANHPALAGLRLETEVDHGGGAGSDHQPFLLAGVPTVYVRTSLPPDAFRWYHNAGDTFEKVDFEAVRGAAGVAAGLVWELADHPGRPLRHLSAEETGVLVKKLGW